MKKSNEIQPKPAREDREQKVPKDFRKVLVATPEIAAVWRGLTPIARRDFVTWIEGAKQPETHAHRIEKAGSMLLAGKRRPCCYAVVPISLYKALRANSKTKATWKNLTPMARRDFVSWIDEAKDQGLRRPRIEKVASMFLAGKRRPS